MKIQGQGQHFINLHIFIQACFCSQQVFLGHLLSPKQNQMVFRRTGCSDLQTSRNEHEHMDMPGGGYMITNTNVLVYAKMRRWRAFCVLFFYPFSSAGQYRYSQPHLFFTNSHFHTIISFDKRAFWSSHWAGHNVQHSAQLIKSFWSALKIGKQAQFERVVIHVLLKASDQTFRSCMFYLLCKVQKLRQRLKNVFLTSFALPCGWE